MAVAVAGHIAAGKSLVRRMLVKCGARGLDWDDIARALLKKGSPTYAALVQVCGASALTETGEISRCALSSLVLSSQKTRMAVNELLQHTIKRELAEQIARFKRSGLRSMIAVEVPLLSADVAGFFDHRVWVECDRNTLIARLAARNHIAVAKAVHMVEVCELGSIERRLCTHTIDNSDRRRVTRRAVELLYQKLLRCVHAIQ
jgi:dephospho-CoA kinase